MSAEDKHENEALLVELIGGGVIVLLNVVANRLLPQRMQVPAHLAAAGLAVMGARAAGVTWRDQGLGPRDAPRGVVTGIATASVLATIPAAGLAAPGASPFYQDERIVKATARQMLYQVLVRIPLATALPEELIFRGSFLGLLAKQRSPIMATAATSVLFGLWHVLPTVDRIQSNPGTRHAHGAALRTVAVVAAHVAATAAMGLGLSALRFRSKSIVAPVLAHATPNAVGFLAGWAVARAPNLRNRMRRVDDLNGR